MAKNKKSDKVSIITTPEQVIAQLNDLRAARERLTFSSTIKQNSLDETTSEHTKSGIGDVDNGSFRHKVRLSS